MNIKSNAEAFELALWLAITAETEEQSRSAIDLAIEVGSKIPREQCEAIKLKVERKLAEETGHVH